MGKGHSGLGLGCDQGCHLLFKSQRNSGREHKIQAEMSGLVAASAWAGAWGALWVSGFWPLDKGKSGSRKTGLAQGCWLESELLTLFPFNKLTHCVLKWGSHSCGVVRALALRGVTTKRKQEFGPEPSRSPSS